VRKVIGYANRLLEEAGAGLADQFHPTCRQNQGEPQG
jgi:hypothetical protein